MSLQPLPQAALTADALRKMARDLMLQADALEATIETRPARTVEFEFSKRKRKERKEKQL